MERNSKVSSMEPYGSHTDGARRLVCIMSFKYDSYSDILGIGTINPISGTRKTSFTGSHNAAVSFTKKGSDISCIFNVPDYSTHGVGFRTGPETEMRGE